MAGLLGISLPHREECETEGLGGYSNGGRATENGVRAEQGMKTFRVDH